jgi:hypothetical protein
VPAILLAASGCGHSSQSPEADAGGAGLPSFPPPDAGDARVDEQANAASPDAADADAPATEDGPAAADSPDAAAGDGGQDASETAAPIATTKPCASPVASGDVLLELGHAAPIVRIRQSGVQVLSEDATGHWVVWDTTARAPLISGDAATCLIPYDPNCVDSPVSEVTPVYGVDLAGTTLAVGGPDHITLLSAADGHALGSVPWTSTDGAWALAADGSYVWAASESVLGAWSPEGQKLVGRTGDYESAQILAAPQQLLVAQGPAGQGNAIESISLATGKSTVGAQMNTTFWSWFLDGSGRYLTADATADTTIIGVFASDGTMLDRQTLQAQIDELVGQGQFFWTLERPPANSDSVTLKVYKLGGGGVPTRIVPSTDPSLLLPSGVLLAMRTGPVTVLDLSSDGANPLTTTVPDAYVFAADPKGNWSIGDYSGVVYGGGTEAAPAGAQPLDCGEVQSIAGASTGDVVIATAVGQTLSIDVGSRTLRAALALPAARVQLSADGTLLAALGSALQLVALPDLVPIKSWPTVDANKRPSLVDFSLASGGSRLAQTSSTDMSTNQQISVSFRRWVEDTQDADKTVDDEFTVNNRGLLLAPVALSPNGAFAAVCDTLIVLNSSTPDAMTRIFNGATEVGSVAGYPIGWLDDQHLLLWRALKDSTGVPVYAGALIADAQGNAGSLIPLPVAARWSKLTPAGVYDTSGNKLYSTADGHVLWPTGAAPAPAVAPAGDVAGSRLVFASGHQVMVSSLSSN